MNQPDFVGKLKEYTMNDLERKKMAKYVKGLRVKTLYALCSEEDRGQRSGLRSGPCNPFLAERHFKIEDIGLFLFHYSNI